MEEPRMICAREFVLVDDEGSPRANWAMDDGGQATINFFDRDGNVRLAVGVGRDGLPIVSLNGPARFPTAFITIDETGDFKFACLDASGDNRFQIIVAADGSHAILGLGGKPPNIVLGAVDGVPQFIQKTTKL